MAVKSDIASDLTLEIDGTNVTPDKFLRSVRSFFSILSEVTSRIAGKASPLQWTVVVREGSSLVGVQPVAGFDPAVLLRIESAIGEGLATLEASTDHPRYFSERAIKSLRELGEIVGTSDSDDTIIRVWVKKTPVSVTHKTVANVSQILAGEHEDYGSIDGRLQTVTERGGLQFVVYEPLWDRPIRCKIPEHLTEVAIKNFRNRVEVYGLIKYRKDGKPISIQVDDIVPFPPKERIPSFREVHGLLREAT